MFWLEEAGLPITGANIARAMQLSPPTVHEMIGRLEGDGYVTAQARQVARLHRQRPRRRAIVRRHRLIERFLTDVCGSPGTRSTRRPSGSSTRCRRCWRSACSPRSATRQTCPHGHPIVEGVREHGVLLADVEPGAESRCCASRTRPRRSSTTSRTPAPPGLEGKLNPGRRRGRDRRRRKPRGRRERRRDRLGPRRPGAALLGRRCPSSSWSPATATAARGANRLPWRSRGSRRRGDSR